MGGPSPREHVHVVPQKHVFGPLTAHEGAPRGELHAGRSLCDSRGSGRGHSAVQAAFGDNATRTSRPRRHYTASSSVWASAATHPRLRSTSSSGLSTQARVRREGRHPRHRKASSRRKYRRRRCGGSSKHACSSRFTRIGARDGDGGGRGLKTHCSASNTRSAHLPATRQPYLVPYAGHPHIPSHELRQHWQRRVTVVFCGT